MERWIGRVALVTGASAGIGAGICEMLVEHGLIVVGCARNVARVQEVISLSIRFGMQLNGTFHFGEKRFRWLTD